MYIEIRKVGFVNKGAELMLHAVLSAVGERYPHAKFVMAPTTRRGPAPYADRALLGLYQKAWLWHRGIQWGDLAELVPEAVRDRYGVVVDRDLDLVLDAAGFAYSDQWGDAGLLELDRATARWKKRGTKVVLLPQAFGPFTTAAGREALKRSVERIDLVCARDERSYEHLIEVTGERSNIRRFGDFTNLVEGIPPDPCRTPLGGFCLVPNARMVDKVAGAKPDTYVEFFVRCSRMAQERGERPFLLIHGGRDDVGLADAISRSAGGIPVISESHPLRIKGIIGASRASVGSRFHGLVSALSQGVPSMGTGWSHKYQALFGDYGCGDLLVDIDVSVANLEDMLDRLIQSDSREALVQRLRARAWELKEESRCLWSAVFEVIETGAHMRQGRTSESR